MAEFHIHIDAEWLSGDLEAFAVQKLGFQNTDFVTPRPGAETFQPNRHFTLKPARGADFRRSFGALVAAAEGSGGLAGFLEGEVVGKRMQIADRPFDRGIPVPFKIARTSLPIGCFRQSELHIRMMEDGSHVGLMRNLEAMGFFSARTVRPNGMAVLFTAQGSRRDVGVVIDLVSAYLRKAGGTRECTIKEERIVRYWLSRTDLALPPIIGRIELKGDRSSLCTSSDTNGTQPRILSDSVTG